MNARSAFSSSLTSREELSAGTAASEPVRDSRPVPVDGGYRCCHRDCCRHSAGQLDSQALGCRAALGAPPVILSLHCCCRRCRYSCCQGSLHLVAAMVAAITVLQAKQVCKQGHRQVGESCQPGNSSTAPQMRTESQPALGHMQM